MRDLVVREALKTMARDAAKRLREIVAAGHQIPYDVEESGGGTALPQYIPLTARFIRDQASALLELDSFGSGSAAIESAGLATASAPSWPGSSSCAGSGTGRPTSHSIPTA
jgi:hypothetical protein